MSGDRFVLHWNTKSLGVVSTYGMISVMEPHQTAYGTKKKVYGAGSLLLVLVGFVRSSFTISASWARLPLSDDKNRK